MKKYTIVNVSTNETFEVICESVDLPTNETFEVICESFEVDNIENEYKMLTNEEIADKLLSDIFSYKDNIKEIIIGRLMDSANQRIYWDAWFRGAIGKDLENAENGKIFDDSMNYYDENIWSEIHSDFEENNVIYIDAWKTGNDNESGNVIAMVNTITKAVIYNDDRAKTNKFAQEVINDVLKTL